MSKSNNRFLLLEEGNIYVPKSISNNEVSDTMRNVHQNSKSYDAELYVPKSMKSNEKVLELKTSDFPSLDSMMKENKLDKSAWGNNIKLSVIKDELRVSPILTNKNLSSEKEMTKCYYGECCKIMNKNIARYHNKYGVNEYDKNSENYYYIDTYYGHLAFSSPSKFTQMIEEMEANGESPYFGEYEDRMVMDEY